MKQIVLADSFVEALTKLHPADVKRAVAFMDKLIHASDAAGLHPEIVHDSRGRAVRSFKVSRDLRAIGHVASGQVTLLFVGQHDDAYAWAGARCVECHPITDEVRVLPDPGPANERIAAAGAVAEAERIAGRRAAPPVRPLFERASDSRLLALGVPGSWLPTVRMIYTEDMLLSIAEDLPADVADSLVDLAIELHPEARGLSKPAGGFTRQAWTCASTEEVCRLLDEHGIDHGFDA